MMKKSVWLLILCLLTALACPAGLAESTDFTVTVTIPEDFEGELNGRLLFLVDNELPAEGEQLYDSVDVTGIPVFGKTVFGLQAGDTITMTPDDPDVYGWPDAAWRAAGRRICGAGFLYPLYAVSPRGWREHLGHGRPRRRRQFCR